jgi:hypothetical protein
MRRVLLAGRGWCDVARVEFIEGAGEFKIRRRWRMEEGRGW